MIVGDRELSDLPRKFNVALTGRRILSTHVWTQDLSYIACRKPDGIRGFQILLGGNQGQSPHLASHIRRLWITSPRSRHGQVNHEYSSRGGSLSFSHTRWREHYRGGIVGIMDHVGKARRSEIMSSIRSNDTQPEKAVRSLIHRMGYRFRLHVNTLPGKADIVLPRHRKVVFVHGCFWHAHAHCSKGRPPRSNLSFWLPKLTANRKRDRRAVSNLRRQGWDVLVVWQCQLRQPEALKAALRRFLKH